jgi:hypothetical protein
VSQAAQEKIFFWLLASVTSPLEREILFAQTKFQQSTEIDKNVSAKYLCPKLESW